MIQKNAMHLAGDFRTKAIKVLNVPVYIRTTRLNINNFRLLWPCIMKVGWRDRNQQDASNLMFIIKFYLNMFRASLLPSSGEKECAQPHMVFGIGSGGCGSVELGCKLYAQWSLVFDLSQTVNFTVYRACIPARHSHTHHYQCRTPYAAMHTIVLLMMGIMMP